MLSLLSSLYYFFFPGPSSKWFYDLIILAIDELATTTYTNFSKRNQRTDQQKPPPPAVHCCVSVWIELPHYISVHALVPCTARPPCHAIPISIMLKRLMFKNHYYSYQLSSTWQASHLHLLDGLFELRIHSSIPTSDLG